MKSIICETYKGGFKNEQKKYIGYVNNSHNGLECF